MVPPDRLWPRRSALRLPLAVASGLALGGCPGDRLSRTEDRRSAASLSPEKPEPTLVLDVALVVADRGNHRIRRIEGSTVRTVAGSRPGMEDATGADARFRFPFGVAVDRTGRVVVTDQGNDRVRVIAPDRVVTTVAGGMYGDVDGPGAGAGFRQPYGIEVDADGVIYVADTFNHRIRSIALDGTVATIAGSTRGFADGPGGVARFDEPSDLAILEDGALVVADRANHRLRRVDPDGMVSTIAGRDVGNSDGRGVGVGFNRPTSVAVGPEGQLYVADVANHRIRRVEPDGRVETIAGSAPGFSDGVGSSAAFRFPCGVDVLPDGNLVVADRENHRVRHIDRSGSVRTVAGSGEGFADGQVDRAKFSYPYAIAVDLSFTPRSGPR